MTSVIIRILLRYGAGFLAAKGILSAEDGAGFASDPDLQMLLETGAALAIGSVVEGWYWLAHRMGWSK